MLETYLHLGEQIINSGYWDAKGMGEGNGKTVINPLVSRCVECGRLVQTGSLCKTCADSKKFSQENEILKSRLDEKDRDFDELKKQMDFITMALQAKGASSS